MVIVGAFRSSASGRFDLRVNNDIDNQYRSLCIKSSNTVVASGPTNIWTFNGGQDDLNSSAQNRTRIWTFLDYASSANKVANSTGNEPDGGLNIYGVHSLDDTTAITSIQMFPSSGTWGGGTYTLYGEK